VEFTEHQIRAGLEQVGIEPAVIDEAVESIRVEARNEGALGFTDDELKGSARDA
jgi:hypothetical protein